MTTKAQRYSQFLKQSADFRGKVHSLDKIGLSQSEIGRKLGVTRQRVNQILNEAADRARTAVWKAIQDKKLPKASSQVCVDCGAKATEYDHRDYAKPLLVEPVCQPCNRKRGKGLNPS